MKPFALILSTFCVLAFSSCKTLRNLGSGDHSSANHLTKQNKGRDLKFIDGVAVTPGVSGPNTAHNVSENPNKKAEIAYIKSESNFNIEKADWLQLKYAIVLDATVEKLINLSLLKDIDHWWGTHYCMGGKTENCIDCSGFTQTIMQDIYNIKLPRTAQEQFDASNKIDIAQLQEGDLVFFHTSGRNISHVGIYLMNNKFVHAATSGGVMVSDLNEAYWKPRFKGAGRVK